MTRRTPWGLILVVMLGVSAALYLLLTGIAVSWVTGQIPEGESTTFQVDDFTVSTIQTFDPDDLTTDFTIDVPSGVGDDPPSGPSLGGGGGGGSSGGGVIGGN